MKNNLLTTNNDLICIKCNWENYYDFRIIMKNGSGHVRLTVFPEENIISDLFVVENSRQKGVATILLNYIDELLNGDSVNVIPCLEWQKQWYIKRGYNIIDYNKPLSDNELNDIAKKDIYSEYYTDNITHAKCFYNGFKLGYQYAADNL